MVAMAEGEDEGGCYRILGAYCCWVFLVFLMVVVVSIAQSVYMWCCVVC